MVLRRFRLADLGAVVLVVSALVAGVVGPTPIRAQAAANPTIVTLTFDDGDADQFAAAQTLQDNNMRGTFYVTTNWIGAEYYLSREQLTALAADGHEIGGHTVTHANLTQVSEAEQQAEICNGREVLQSWGFEARNFAYPFAASNSSAQRLAAECGYDTARGLGGIRSPRSCTDCPPGETMPPRNPYFLRAPNQVDSTWTLAQLRATVTRAVQGDGGWVILTFHHVCADIGAANCQADQSITPQRYNRFVTWLNNYRNDPANNVRVQTVDETVREYQSAD